jgi:hypothetical protein
MRKQETFLVALHALVSSASVVFLAYANPKAMPD